MATLAPSPSFKAFTAAGLPLAGGKLYTYQSGTTTPLATYTDQTGATPNANPVILDANGEASVWLGSAAYKFVLTDSLGSVIRTTDKIYAPGSSLGATDIGADDGASGSIFTTVQGFIAKILSSAGSSLIGFIQSGAGAVFMTLQALLRSMPVSPQQFGGVGDGLADDTTKIQLAIGSGAKVLDLCGKTWRITEKLIFSVSDMEIKNGTLLYDGSTSERMANVTADNVVFRGVVFNANNKQPRSALVYVETGVSRPQFLGCTFKSMRCVNNGLSVLNQSYAILINPYSVTNFSIDNCLFKDLTKYNDGVNGAPIVAAASGIGFVGGVCFLPEDMSAPNAVQATPTSGIIHACTFDNIQTILANGLSLTDQEQYNDADAIRTYGVAGGAENLYVHVSDCIFRSVSKRAFKFRARGAVATNCEIYADGMQYGMVLPIDCTNDADISNIRVFASAAKPVQIGVQWSILAGVSHRKTKVSKLYVSNAISGVNIISDGAGTNLYNFYIENSVFDGVTAGGISQGTLPASMDNIVINGVQIFASGNNCAGINLAGANDVTCGAKISDVYIKNASFKVAGINNEITDVTVEISSNTYAGASAGESLFRVGIQGYGGYQKVNGLFINAWNLNTGYLSATRTLLGEMSGDNADWNNVRIKVPDGLSQSYDHAGFWGSDWHISGLKYDGPGRISLGSVVASSRWSVVDAVRLGAGASATAFLVSNNVSTVDGFFNGIADYRPTTANTITIGNGLRFIVYNVGSKSSNATIVQHGGLAKTANINTF